RVLVSGRDGRTRPAGHHRKGRGHQEGLGPRRRLVRPAHRALLVLELVLHEQRVSDQALERLPQRLAKGWMTEGVAESNTEGAAAAAPSAPEGSGLDLIGLTKEFPGGTLAVDDVNL